MRCGRRFLVLALVVGTLVVPGSGCSCAEPGPWLGSAPDGGLALGWNVTGAETVHQVQLLEGEAVRWQIDAVDTEPRVIPLGKDSAGFTTAVPLVPGASMEGMTLRVQHASDRVAAEPSDFVITDGELTASLRAAAVEEYECGFSAGDARALALAMTTWLLAAIGVVLMAAYLVWLVLRLVTRRSLPPPGT